MEERVVVGRIGEGRELMGRERGRRGGVWIVEGWDVWLCEQRVGEGCESDTRCIVGRMYMCGSCEHLEVSEKWV